MKKALVVYEGLLAPTTGIEPVTDRLTADCSTAELRRIVSMWRIIASRTFSVYPF
jgi:hypothetical protein